MYLDLYPESGQAYSYGIQAYYYMGYAAFAAGDYKQAVEFFRKDENDAGVGFSLWYMGRKW